LRFAEAEKKKLCEQVDKEKKLSSTYKERLHWLSSVSGVGLTPRVLLILVFSDAYRIGEQSWDTPGDVGNGTGDLGGEDPEQEQISNGDNLTPERLDSKCLDTVLTSRQAARLGKQLLSSPLAVTLQNYLQIQLCPECRIARFSVSTSKPLAGACAVAKARAERLDEFPQLPTRLVPKKDDKCRACTLAAMTKGMEKYAWFGLDKWAAGARRTADVAVILRCLGDPELDTHLEQMERCEVLRSALKKLDPPPSDDALAASSSIHLALMRGGQMHSFFDARFSATTPNDEGRVPPFAVGAVRRVSVTFKGEVVGGVPIFMRYLRRRSATSNCAVCSEKYFEVDLGDERAWTAAREHMEDVKEYDWTSGLLHFPTVDMLRDCEHEFDTCKGCLAQYIQTQVEASGRASCNDLSCPTVVCRRIFRYDEIRRLASAETFAR